MGVGAAAVEEGDFVATSQGVANDVGADEAGSAQDEDAEAGLVQPSSSHSRVRRSYHRAPAPPGYQATPTAAAPATAPALPMNSRRVVIRRLSVSLLCVDAETPIVSSTVNA